jgi:hypothetical protein
MPAGTDLVVVVDPRDGTILEDLASHPDSELADVVYHLRDREKQFADMRRALETELVARMSAAGHKRKVVGIFEIEYSTGSSRVWDAETLEGVLWDLADRGVIEPREWTGLVARPAKVDGHMAAKLLGQLVGQAKAQVEACFQWKEGRPRVTVTPSRPLIESED